MSLESELREVLKKHGFVLALEDGGTDWSPFRYLFLNREKRQAIEVSWPDYDDDGLVFGEDEEEGVGKEEGSIDPYA